jgi:hypothetical protein
MLPQTHLPTIIKTSIRKQLVIPIMSVSTDNTTLSAMLGSHRLHYQYISPIIMLIFLQQIP